MGYLKNYRKEVPNLSQLTPGAKEVFESGVLPIAVNSIGLFTTRKN